jgi:hypothetical protein
MRCSSTIIGLIEIDSPVADRWWSSDPAAPLAEREDVVILSAQLAQLTDELHVEWRALVEHARLLALGGR